MTSTQQLLAYTRRCLWQPMSIVLIVCMSSLVLCNGWAPKSKAELQDAIRECLQLRQKYCNKGPHGPIGSWDVSAVTDMSWLLADANYDPLPGANNFNGDMSNWDVSRVTDMASIFHSASSFNGDLSKWDVSRVTNMASMFESASSFNGDISNWDVSSVNSMKLMFFYAASFNADITEWDVSSVTDMTSMFSWAIMFNRDISKWNVARVTSMNAMFVEAAWFNQKLCGVAWARSTASKINMFAGSSTGKISQAVCVTTKAELQAAIEECL